MLFGHMHLQDGWHAHSAMLWCGLSNPPCTRHTQTTRAVSDTKPLRMHTWNAVWKDHLHSSLPSAPVHDSHRRQSALHHGPTAHTRLSHPQLQTELHNPTSHHTNRLSCCAGAPPSTSPACLLRHSHSSQAGIKVPVLQPVPCRPAVGHSPPIIHAPAAAYSPCILQEVHCDHAGNRQESTVGLGAGTGARL